MRRRRRRRRRKEEEQSKDPAVLVVFVWAYHADQQEEDEDRLMMWWSSRVVDMDGLHDYDGVGGNSTVGEYRGSLVWAWGVVEEDVGMDVDADVDFVGARR